MTDHIRKLIAEGEHQRLDFKFEVADYHKIARSIVAFANTDGGRLLVGVKDNGSVAGVRSEEEIFMVEGAARLYCRPEVSFTYREWNVEGRRVVEFIVMPSASRPHYAEGEDGRWLVWVRRGDQILLANAVLISVWEKQRSGYEAVLRYTEAERMLLKRLEEGQRVTLNGFCRLTGISRGRATRILVDLMIMGIIGQEITERETYYIIRSL